MAAVRPKDYEALLALGTICANSNRQEDAKRYFRKLIAVHGNAPNAHGSLGAVHASCGELAAAVACYEKALKLAPDHPGVRYALAMVLADLGRSADAIAQIRLALSKRPDHLELHFALGNLLYGQGQNAEAMQCYARVLQFSPRHAETHNNLGNVLLSTAQHERAIAHYKTAIEINPTYADAHGNLGNAFLELNRLEESIAQNRRALELKPLRFGSYNNLGVALQALGRFEEAKEAFGRAIELAPQEASVHLNLANMDRFKPDDNRLPALRRLLDGVDALDDERQIAARFAMGKALSDLKRYDDAFAELNKANALKRKHIDYDEGQRLGMLEKITTIFTRELISSRSESGDRSWSPIFIVGMPRSGTTLMEQVLASHSKVFGAGELETFKEMVIGAVDSQAIFPAYPELVEFAVAGNHSQDRRDLYVARPRIGAGCRARRGQDAAQLRVCRAHPHGAAECEDHSYTARPARHLRLLLLAVVHRQPALRLRSRGARPLSSLLRGGDGALAPGAAAGHADRRAVRGSRR